MSNEQTIWNFLIGKFNNPYGVAGLMGNLYAESRLSSILLESSYARKFGKTSQQYTNEVDNGSYSKEQFKGDSAGYGLAQWTYWSRKEALYDYAKSVGKSIGDLDMQLEYMYDELKKYKTVFNTITNAKSVKEASDVVMARYEKNANQSEENKIRRASFGQTYYYKYANEPIPSPIPDPSPIPSHKVKYVETNTNNVNVRIGNGLNYPITHFIQSKGTKYKYVAESENGWYAIDLGIQVGWIMKDFTRIVEV